MRNLDVVRQTGIATRRQRTLSDRATGLARLTVMYLSIYIDLVATAQHESSRPHEARPYMTDPVTETN